MMEEHRFKKAFYILEKYQDLIVELDQNEIIKVTLKFVKQNFKILPILALKSAESNRIALHYGQKSKMNELSIFDFEALEKRSQKISKNKKNETQFISVFENKSVSESLTFPVKNKEIIGALVIGFEKLNKPSVFDINLLKLISKQFAICYSHSCEQYIQKRELLKHETIFLSQKDVVVVIDLDWKIVDVNQTTTNFDKGELIGKKLLDLQPDKSERAKAKRNIERAILTRKEIYYRSFLKTNSGISYYSVLVKPIINIDEIAGCVIISSDITKEIKSNEALEKSEKMYRNLIDNAHSIILRISPDQKIIFANNYAHKFFGFKKSELVGKKLTDTIIPNFDSKGKDLYKMVDQAFSDPKSFGNNENENIRKDGTRLWISWANHPYFNEQGKFYEMLSIGNDITEHKTKELEKIRKYQTIDQIHESIIATDLNGIITYVNNGSLLLNGYSREEMMGQHITMLYAEEDYKHLEDEIIGKLVKYGKYRTEAKGLRKNGTKMDLDISLTMLKDDNGEDCGMVGYAVDITDKKQAEKEYNLLSSIVKNANDIIGIADLKGQVIYVNEYAQHLLGMSENYKQTKIFDYFTQEALDEVNSKILPSVLQNERWKGESQFKNIKTGECIDVLFDIFIINDPHTGMPTHMATISREIGQLKKQQNYLEKSKKALKEAQEIGKVGSWELKLTENKLYWSDQIYRLLGIEIGSIEADYEKFLTFVHPDDREKVDLSYKEHIENDTKYSMTHRVIDAHGNTKYVHEQGKTTRDKNGIPIRTLGTVTDITEYKLIELELERYKENLENLVYTRTQELKSSMSKLNENELKYRTLVESTSMGIGITNDKDVVYANKALMKMFGYRSMKTFKSKSIFEHASDEGKEILKKRVESLKKGLPVSDVFQVEYVKKSGEHFQCQVAVKNIEFEGKPCRHASFVDISELISTEEKLRQSEALYRLLADNTSDIISIIDSEFNIKYISPSVKQFLGYTVDKIKKHKSIDLIHPDDISKFLSVMEVACENQAEALILSYRCKAKNGKYIWFEHSMNFSYDLEGNFVQCISTARNISTRVQTEHDLKKLNDSLILSNAEYQKIANELTKRIHEVDQKNELIKNQNDLLLNSEGTLKLLNTQLSVRNNAINEITILSATNNKGELIEVNQKFIEISGFTKSEVLGQSHRMVNSNYHSKSFFKDMWDTIIIGKIWRGEVRNMAKNGSFFWVLKTIVPFKLNEGDDDWHYFSLSIDITQLKEREQELELSKQETERALGIKEDFLSIMSHEIRTPLNSVIGLSELLLNKKPKKSQLEILKTLNLSADNLMKLITDILDYTKIQAGKVEVVKQPFNIHDLLTETKNVFQSIAKEKGIYLRMFLCTDLPEMVNSDATRLKQILNNLVLNAIKFTNKGEVVIQARMISLIEDKTVIRLTVKDTGIGINPTEQETIFEAFEQSKMQLSHQKGGTGLGLAIVKKLVDLFEGTIQLESTVGIGSCFDVEIPFDLYQTAQNMKDDAVNIRIIKRLKFDGKKVLYIEDVYTNQFLMQNFLEDLNIECDLAASGEEAIEKLKVKKYDLLLMDIQMPGMDGYETTKLIRLKESDYKETPIIAFTADTTELTKRKIEQAGMNDIITKPMNSTRLISLLEEYLCEAQSAEFLPFSFDYYNKAFKNEPEKMGDFYKALKQDLKLFESNYFKYYQAHKIDLLNREIHKIKPIISQLKYQQLLEIFEKFSLIDPESTEMKALNIKMKELLRFIIDHVPTK